MQYLSNFSAIANSLDLVPNTLAKFHLPFTSMLKYTVLVKEFYKKLLQATTTTNMDLGAWHSYFQHIDLLFSVLLSAGGDTVISPRVAEYNRYIERIFEDPLTDVNLQTLLAQIVWIVRRIGKTFGITSMESLKID